MSSKFERFTCWTETTAGEAGFHTLGSRNSVDDAMVLATKVDIPISPYGASEIIASEDLINGFISSFNLEEANTVYAITGDSGSGKTFLIRCAQAQIDKDSRAHVVYVPRDVASLQGILKLILSELPGEAAQLALREVESSNVEELETELLLQLVHAQIRVEIAQGHGLDVLLEDESLTEKEKLALPNLYGTKNGEIYRSGLSEFLAHPEVMNHMLRESGNLWNQVRTMKGEVADEENALFLDSEFPKVVQARKKMPELEDFLFYFDEHKSLAAKVIENVKVAALGAQVKTSRDLTEIVEDARLILDSQGKQLVLMFEDIARNGVGLSNAVFDLFRSAGVRRLKPIRVMFATTAGYWKQIPANVRNTCRRFEVKNLISDDPRTLDIGFEIIAKYLNAARLGKRAIIDAWNVASENDRSSEEWIPNKCDGCQFQPECHEEFGSIGSIGLYPLNKIAARNVLRHLENVNSNPGFSPRLIVRMLISEWLRDSEATLKANKFPTGQIEELVGPGTSIDLVDLWFSAPEQERLGRPLVERIHRARVAWADYPQDSYSKSLASAFGLEDTGTDSGPKKLTVSNDGDFVPSQLNTPPIRDRWFTTEYSEIAEWATNSSKKITPSLVDELRKFLSDLISQSLRLDKHLVKSTSPEIKLLIDSLLGLNSIQIEDCYGDETYLQRVQRRLERSTDSYRLILAALWFMRSGTWDTEFSDENELWKCDPVICVHGRLLLMEWVDECAKEIALRVREAVSDAYVATVKAQVRLMTLHEPNLMSGDLDQSISRLVFDATLKSSVPIDNGESLQELLADFDSFLSGCGTAYQEDGNRRLAEDLVTKARILKEFRESPDWRVPITLNEETPMVAMNEKVGRFSVEIANHLQSTAETIKGFKDDFGAINLDNLKNELVVFRQVFESVISRRQTLQQPQSVRKVIENIEAALPILLEEKEDLIDQMITADELSDSQLWSIAQQFPFLNSWTQDYRQLMQVAQGIATELEDVIGARVLPDTDALRSSLDKCLSDIQIPTVGISDDK
jgi:hypothetical protein